MLLLLLHFDSDYNQDILTQLLVSRDVEWSKKTLAIVALKRDGDAIMNGIRSEKGGHKKMHRSRSAQIGRKKKKICNTQKGEKEKGAHKKHIENNINQIDSEMVFTKKLNTVYNSLNCVSAYTPTSELLCRLPHQVLAYYHPRITLLYTPRRNRNVR